MSVLDRKDYNLIIFCNGILNKKEDLLAPVELIRTFAGRTVNVISFYNDTSPTVRDVKNLFVEYVKDWIEYSPSDARAALGTIREYKQKLALDLQVYVNQFLRFRPYTTVTLVAHSQGAHIVAEAVKGIESAYKPQVRACFIGGITTIPEKDVKRYVAEYISFQNARDVLSQAAQKYYAGGSSSGTHNVSVSKDDCVVCHSALDYLNIREVQGVIRKYSSYGNVPLPMGADDVFFSE